MWYVTGFLIPSMISQGIPESEIEIWEDEDHIGCLMATIESFRACGSRRGGTWHLQDDVAISHDFAEKTKKHDEGIVHGFFFRHHAESDLHPGKTPVLNMGYSFPCIRIPNEIAKEFADWFDQDARFREKYQRWIEGKKYVDAFFMVFLHERYTDGFIYNLKPSIVEHVDYLLGGSTINQWREVPARATYWEDKEIIEDLKRQLAHRN